jgi:hypothetical protein
MQADVNWRHRVASHPVHSRDAQYPVSALQSKFLPDAFAARDSKTQAWAKGACRTPLASVTPILETCGQLQQCPVIDHKKKRTTNRFVARFT